MKPSTSVFVQVPQDFLPDVIELLTASYIKLQGVVEKKEKTISELQFDIAELRNKAKIAEAKEAANGDDF